MSFSMSGEGFSLPYNRFDAFEKALLEGKECKECGDDCDCDDCKSDKKKDKKKSSAKPDYLDVDKDGDKEEDMTDALGEGYQRNPEKGEKEDKKYAPVRGEKTPMPPRGNKRREDFEKWYAKNVKEGVDLGVFSDSEIDSLVEMYSEEFEQLDEISDRKVRSVRDAREKQWHQQFGKNRVKDPTDDMTDKVDELIDQRNKRTGSKVKKTTMGQLTDKHRKEEVDSLMSGTLPEGYQRSPEKGEKEDKKYAPVRGEKTPMPPRGNKRREDFEKWYAANVKEDVDLSIFSDSEIDSLVEMYSEEFEQLDEISNKTLGSYVKKASKDVEKRSYSQGSTDAEDAEIGYPGQTPKDKKIDKRQKGIGKAVDKMTRKEEVDSLMSAYSSMYSESSVEDQMKVSQEYFKKRNARSPEEKAAEKKAEDKSRAKTSAMHKQPDPYKARQGESD